MRVGVALREPRMRGQQGLDRIGHMPNSCIHGRKLRNVHATEDICMQRAAAVPVLPYSSPDCAP